VVDGGIEVDGRLRPALALELLDEQALGAARRRPRRSHRTTHQLFLTTEN
jgi:hypothetical protein